MLYRIFSVFISCLAILSLGAKDTYTNKLKKNTRLTICQDTTIDRLVNGNVVAAPIVVVRENPKNNSSQQPTKHSKPQKVVEKEKKPTVSPRDTSVALSSPKKQSTTARGYRVKIYMGGSTRVDKDNARQAGHHFKTAFPDVSVYIHFVSPHWIILAGDFVTREDALSFIHEIKQRGYVCAIEPTVVKSLIKAAE